MTENNCSKKFPKHSAWVNTGIVVSIAPLATIVSPIRQDVAEGATAGASNSTALAEEEGEDADNE